MNFAPAGTAPFPVAAKVLPPIGAEGEGSHSYMCRLRVANARLSAAATCSLHPLPSFSLPLARVHSFCFG